MVAWMPLNPRQQDRVVEAIGALIRKEFAHKETVAYGSEVTLRIPTFTHLTSGLEFNLIFGGVFQMGLTPEEQYLLQNPSHGLKLVA